MENLKLATRTALGSVNSLGSLQLESESMRATILPDVGAEIYDLIWKASGRNILWHNPRIEPQRFPIEANFDNYWSGGWDEGFPTCELASTRVKATRTWANCALSPGRLRA
jgi:hypothetical protein